MSQKSIIADRIEGALIVGVMQGRELTDIYADRSDSPDLTGAVVLAKITRVLRGQNAAIVALPDKQEGYASLRNAREGVMAVLQVKASAHRGKLAQLVPHKMAAPEKSVPQMLVPPPGVIARAAMDFHDGVKEILIAPREDAARFRDWCEAHAPELIVKVRQSADLPRDLAEDIDMLATPEVALQGGGNLIIESTAALTAIDVNGGDAGNPLQVNLRAADQIARQMRLRNLCGIIVVDFISMSKAADRARLLDKLRGAVKDDPAGVNVMGMSKLGLVELTRTRRGRTLEEVLHGR